MRIKMLTLDKVYHASYTLKDVIRKTDLIHAPNINPESQIYLKTENLPRHKMSQIFQCKRLDKLNQTVYNNVT